MPVPGLELIILLVIVLIIFGPGKLPDIGNAIGKGIREFRKASNDLEESIRGEPKRPAVGRRARRRALGPLTPADPATRRHPPRDVMPDTAMSAADDDATMSLIEHLEELRRRIIVVAIAIAARRHRRLLPLRPGPRPPARAAAGRRSTLIHDRLGRAFGVQLKIACFVGIAWPCR